ncbi:MAG: hypothetical protein ABIO29_05555 [Sphingomicrobium sp.]
MHYLVLLFRLMLVLVAAYAFWRGSRDERLVAGICLAGAILSKLVVSPLQVRYFAIEPAIMTVDLLVLAAFVHIALYSKRFWPLWIAGLQLTTIMGHLLKAVGGDLIPSAYGIALGFWAYPIILILAIATWRTGRWRGRIDGSPLLH